MPNLFSFFPLIFFMSVGIDIGIDAQSDVGGFGKRTGDGINHCQFFFGFDVDLADSRIDGIG